MAEGIELGDGKDVSGCTDPAASNFNPLATISCGPTGPVATPGLGGVYTNGCCTYGSVSVTGCMDPQANNFNPVATISCNGCCDYGNPDDVELDFGDLVLNPNGMGGNDNDPISDIKCENLIYTESLSGEIVVNGNASISEECCTWYQSYVNPSVSWDQNINICYVSEGSDSLCEMYDLGLITSDELQQRVICVDCDNFAWWDNLYTTINGGSLQNINAPLWDFLVNIITSDPTNPVTPNFGNGSFYIDVLTGEPIIDENCCTALLESNFVINVNEFGEESSACLCDTTHETITECECVEDVETFLSIASTIGGASLLLTPNVLSSLGLTSDEIIFVINNTFSTDDTDNNGVSDNAQIRILLSNALALTGGFYLCYEKIPTANIPNNEDNGLQSSSNNTIRSLPNQGTIEIPQLAGVTECEGLGGFFDGALCFCKPQDECNVNLTDLTMTSIVDDFNQNITIVTIGGESISETCCLKIASENQLSWVYESYNGVFNCFITDPNPCLPLEFKLNSDLIKPECETPIDVSVSFYFGKPENPCIPFEDDGEVIIIDNPTEPCILEFDEDNNLIDYNTTTIRRDKLPPIINEPPISGDTEPPCCYNPDVPISVNLVIRDDKNNIIQTSESFSFVDVETWFDITTQFTIPTTGTTEGFNAYLQFTSGLNCCCIYDIFLDNFNFNCNEEINIVEIINNDCPGFEISPVIDNKKSWVYNPGEINYSNLQNNVGKLTDNVIINQGQYGLIQGYGDINRTFAPSLDADLTWRYTDYFKQSSVLEKHSNLVLNSKELFLTFDMCNIGGPCPDNYILSAGTETCYKTTIGCIDNFTLSGNTCYSGATTASTTTIILTQNSDPLACRTKFTLLELEGYKKTFQSFWVQFVEQFIPATTIFVSGERWCNRPDEICVQFDECDFDFEFVEGDVTTIPNIAGLTPPPIFSGRSQDYTPNTGGENRDSETFSPLDYETTKNGPIVTPTVKINPLPKEDGETTIKPLIIGDLENRKKRKLLYQDRLQTTQTIIK